MMNYDLISEKMKKANSILIDLNRNNRTEINKRLDLLDAQLFRDNSLSQEEYFAISSYINGIRVGIMIQSIYC